MLVKIAAASLAFSALLGAPLASALPMAPQPAGAVESSILSVAWYCNGRGHCVKARRNGYVLRGGWQPSCQLNWFWDGYRCASRPVIVIRPHYKEYRRNDNGFRRNDQPFRGHQIRPHNNNNNNNHNNNQNNNNQNNNNPKKM
ncbi:hypothetical protein [Prosthecodimorpha staleyi]|uniref:Uncharacterized protein n=1 Tax=Prosthecodimorpha staleyi TaxID=2840188 RepID=A0A947DBI0_9HYPH|nr:hypothetical protein [Prosthecodimorpha staleyi]MBT9292687.1 hypothetical protein [Prosthecodimorpha staleyi]